MTVLPGTAVVPVVVAVRLSSGPAGLVVTVAELLAAFGSVWPALTVAVLAIAVVKVAGALKVTVTAVVAPLVSTVPVQLRTLLVIEQPVVEVAAFVTPLGSVSLSE